MIPPEHAQLYEWQFSEEKSTVDVVFRFSPMFNARSIKLELTPEKDAISLTIPDGPPLVHGKLAAAVTKMLSRSTSGTSLTFTFKKARVGMWHVLIAGPHPQTSKADPQSAYVMFQVALSQGGWNETSQHWLEMSGSAGYCPALLAGFDLFQQSSETAQKAEEWLGMAATVYGNSDARLGLGVLLMHRPDSVQSAFHFLQQAGNAGLLQAWTRLAQLLSPLSDYAFEAKDAEQAVALLESVRRKTPNDPLMCHELSKLYFNGVGVKRNEQLARQLDTCARNAFQDLPELRVLPIEPKKEELEKVDEPKKDEGGTLRTIAVVGLTIAATVAAGLFGWLAYRRRNR
jgi:hypothetical protein